MLGTALHSDRAHGGDGFYGAGKVRRVQHHRWSCRTEAVVPPSVSGEPESRTRSEVENRKFVPAAAAAARWGGTSPCNLHRFLDATTPSVRAHYLSKATRMKSLRACDEDCKAAYFTLEDLWESFKEWSAYGAGVPLLLNGRDSVVQYYVPYLSGIQLYVDSSKFVSKSQPSQDSDAESRRDSSSDRSSDSEIDRGFNVPSSYFIRKMGQLTVDEKQISFQDGSSRDDSNRGGCLGSLIFEYIEHDRPYCREPLADKIFDLARQFPALMTIKSCDLLPTSWFSVAWYPIYRIPTGPTLRDLEACFLTFHSLYAPTKGVTISSSHGFECVPKVSLPAFGLVSYKFKSSMWISNSSCEGKLVNTLLQAADNWLQLLAVNLPDYCFFSSQNSSRR
ncbi:hypothetical protein AXF42_Ash014377 [Apostasia shenzhenica]|uniref:DUF789 domain-containing protein n=1 Tax=Apostasia shenzhenica TaxID=1088818 RepID=A0A2I0B0Y9_9ASPA|nr:hypothetical protein AXF42_Ash014377 [Apostasia shenzhenica]